jgi:hypothetical protein
MAEAQGGSEEDAIPQKINITPNVFIDIDTVSYWSFNVFIGKFLKSA